MPWDPKQRVAIFLSVKRKKGEKAARELMHKHGYVGKKKKKRKHRRASDVGETARRAKGRR
jgi:hypothetical protein